MLHPTTVAGSVSRPLAWDGADDDDDVYDEDEAPDTDTDAADDDFDDDDLFDEDDLNDEDEETEEDIAISYQPAASELRLIADSETSC